MGKPVNKTLRIAAMSAGEEIGHASGPVVTFRGNSAPLRSLVANIEPVQSGTGDPSPDNVRPISGWTGANVSRTGKNLLRWYAEGETKTQESVTGTVQADGGVKLTGTASGTWWGIGDSPTCLLKAGTYTLNQTGTSSGGIQTILVDHENNTVILSVSGINQSVSFALSSDIVVHAYNKVSSGTATECTIYIWVEPGSTATAYEPYSGNQYTIQLGQTVYGGILDVTNGVLTVDRVYKAFDGTENTWVRSSRYNGSFYVETGFALVLNPSLNFAICSHAVRATTFPINYAFGKFGFDGQSNNPYFNVWIAAANTSLDDFKTYLAGQAQNGTPVSFCCKLATPITIPLTPQEISTLQGQNNVWADSGDVDVEYVSTGGEGGKLALLLRNRKELLIALRKGLSPAEVGLLGSIPSFGGSLSPGVIRPGLNTQEEEEDENKDA